MSDRTCLCIILAAGEGTRMRSGLPKVMHEVGGLPMLGHVLAAARDAGAGRLAVVVGPDAEKVGRFLDRQASEATRHVQKDRLGTAHAVLQARPALEAAADDVLILYGDTPLIRAETLGRMRKALADGADVAVLGFEPADPSGYGRLVLEGGQLKAIREERDASDQEKSISLCNGGIMGFQGSRILPLLDRITNSNAKSEFYLTDAVELANKDGLRVVVVDGTAEEVAGVNTRAELAAAERVFQARARRQAMAGGATLIDPETVYFSHDTKLGRDVLVEPHVVFAPGVAIADGATIRAFSHLDGATVAGGAVVGPYARLRPGAAIAEGARIGNFVEIKNARIDAGAKVNHLSYIGDAAVGAGANIGAGTITCNYDGYAKHHTEIGAGAFIGSNSALVAPVEIGREAYVASGSVITRNVPEGALAVARGRQVDKPGWVAALRSRFKGSGKPD